MHPNATSIPNANVLFFIEQMFHSFLTTFPVVFFFKFLNTVLNFPLLFYSPSAHALNFLEILVLKKALCTMDIEETSSFQEALDEYESKYHAVCVICRLYTSMDKGVLSKRVQFFTTSSNI
jgi:long-subunit acyl-CoA synthetase (AMP-forming)